MISLENIYSLLPLLITCATSIVVMLAIAIKRNHWWNATFTVVGLNLALFSILLELFGPFLYVQLKEKFSIEISQLALPLFNLPQQVTQLFVVDGYSLFFSVLILISALGASTLINAYVENSKRNREEIYLLLIIATAGGLVLAMAHHMASLFIGLEMMSVALYGMVAYTYDRARSLESAIKYMVLSATASSVMLFGIALIYAEVGSLSFAEVGAKVGANPTTLITIGGLMFAIGLLFKLSLAPFHLWTPDVYEGAPAPITAFLATGAKVSVFAVLIRFLLLESSVLLSSDTLVKILVVVGCVSALIGNLLALKQTNIKRMLAYSSIAHFGYVLLLILLAPEGKALFGIGSFAFYLSVYVITSLAAFGVVTLMSSAGADRDADLNDDYRGLFWTRPYLASLFTLALFSLAGIPLTAGFIAKFQVILGLIVAPHSLVPPELSFWFFGHNINIGYFVNCLPLISILLGSAIGIYFYLRTLISLFLYKKEVYEFDAELNWGQTTGGILVLLCGVFILFVGVYPDVLTFVTTAAKFIWLPQ